MTQSGHGIAVADGDAEAARRAARPESNRNRSIVADALKQMVLVIISLGFANAVQILAEPGKTAENGPHVVEWICLPANKSCHGFALDDLLIFAIYVLVGARFLLTNWLYLSTTYREDSPKDLKILPDAIGIFLTGVVIGVQSSYVTAKSGSPIADFFLLFCLILSVDGVFSVISLAVNCSVLDYDDRAQEWRWLRNNVFFGILSLALVFWRPPLEPSSWRVYALIFLAFLNCLMSFHATYRGYFEPTRHIRR
ncbi:MAG TPA: hypothetical protein VEI03_11545 [Stellaceae bacterium]|nr:hypothetical protein [Stellaceae bacterium]